MRAHRELARTNQVYKKLGFSSTEFTGSFPGESGIVSKLEADAVVPYHRLRRIRRPTAGVLRARALFLSFLRVRGVWGLFCGVFSLLDMVNWVVSSSTAIK